MSMNRAVAATAVVFATGLAGAPAYAHHSIQAVVDTSQVVQGTMVLTKVDWINPHSWFHFTMADGKTAGSEVLIEWLSLTGLRQAGYPTANAFAVGDTFTVKYNPNRDGSPGGNLVSMTDQATGQVFDRRGGNPPPPRAPIPQLRPGGPAPTNISFQPKVEIGQ
jgi:hypothetical protein